MSNTTFRNQDEYVNSLKQIKEIEDKVQSEIEFHRKKVEEEIKKLEDDLKISIEQSNKEGKELVEKSVKTARDLSTQEAEKIIKDAEMKSKSIVFQIDKPVMKEIMGILFSEF